ncbi:MAG TPA: phosphatase PAP2 family protein, partial [Gammaproteobacteria bacterium]|nr:phosphatase PAP2 family protein [Gammaproteobacteria bacterium]
MSEQAQSGWRREAVARFRSHWLLKGVGITAYITAFMWVYFTLLRHPQFPVTIMPLQSLDRWIGFAPWALIPYASLWFYIALVPSLLWLRDEMAPYVSAVTLVCLAGCTIFLFWPTAVPPFDIDWAAHPSVAFLKAADAAGNACPSLHVAFAVLTALWLASLLRRMRAPVLLHVLNAGWCLLIVWSTMALRQHVALDVEAGAVLGGAIAAVHLRVWRPGTVSGGYDEGENG